MDTETTKLTRVLLAAKVTGVSVELSTNTNQPLTVRCTDQWQSVVFLKHLFNVEKGQVSEEFLVLKGVDQLRLQAAINRLVTTGLIWPAAAFDYGCE